MECNTNDKSSIWRMICNGEIDMFVEHWTHASVETRCKLTPSSVKLRDAGMLEITPRYSSKKTYWFFLWEEKNPYKSDVGSLILDDTKPPKTLW